MSELLAKAIEAVHANRIDELKAMVPELDREDKGEVLRAIILQRAELARYAANSPIRDNWRGAVVQLLEAGAPTQNLARYPNWFALKEALDFDDAPVMESLLRTVKIDKRSDTYKNFLHMVFSHAVKRHGSVCVKALLRREFCRFIDIDRPVEGKASALVFTLFPDLDLEEHLQAHWAKDRMKPVTPRRQAIALMLLNAGANANQNQPYLNYPLLYETVCRGMDNESLMLLNFGANPKIELNGQEISLLCVAFREQCLMTQKRLLDMPLNFKYESKSGTNLAHHAARFGAFGSVEVLRQKGVDVCAPSPKGCILKFAIGKSDVIFNRVVEYCKNDPRDVVNFQTADGFAPLHIAMMKRRRKHARVLLSELHANPNIQTEKGITPAMFAALGGRLDLLKDLDEFLADFSLTDVKGRNILYSTVLGQNLTVFGFILGKGVLPYGQDSEGNTILHAVTEKGTPEMLEALLPLEQNWFVENDNHQKAVDLLNPADTEMVAVWMRVAPNETRAALERIAAKAAVPQLVTRDVVEKPKGEARVNEG